MLRETPAERLAGQILSVAEKHYASGRGDIDTKFLDVLDALAAAVGIVISTAGNENRQRLDKFFVQQLRLRGMQIKGIERDVITERVQNVMRAR